MSKKVILQWEHHPYTESRGSKDAYLYALSRAGELLYVGKAYRTSAKSEMSAHVYLKDLNKRDLVIWLGHIAESAYGRKTVSLITDIENYLIYWYKPRLNQNKKAEYTGRNELYVANKDFPFYRINIGVFTVFSNETENFEQRIIAIRDIIKQYANATIEQISGEDFKSIYEVHYATIKMRIEYEVNGHRFVTIYNYAKHQNSITDTEKQLVKLIINSFVDSL